MSTEILTDLIKDLNIETNTQDKNEIMATVDVNALIVNAVRTALAEQTREFEKKISQLTGEVSRLEVKGPQVEVFEEIKIFSSIGCDESLDVVKSLPEFHGILQQYISW